MHLNEVIHPSNFPQRENCGWVRLARERWRGTHSREGVSWRQKAAGGVKMGATVGQLEWPVAGEEEEETEELEEKELCVNVNLVKTH